MIPIALLAGAVSLPAGPVGAGPALTTVCHVRGSGDYAPLTVASRSAAAHERHGDGVPGGPVPGADSMVFDETCRPVAAVTDTDGDGVADQDDNCIEVENPDQVDRYGSPNGDACEVDSDGNGVLDVDEPYLCIHIDGVLVRRQPDASVRCASTAPATGGESNIAIAHGRGANARAADGSGNTAIASGASSTASAVDGDHNVARAMGDYSRAFAFTGNRNSATSVGDTATYAFGGDDNAVTADGPGPGATARYGSRNRVHASPYRYACVQRVSDRSVVDENLC